MSFAVFVGELTLLLAVLMPQCKETILFAVFVAPIFSLLAVLVPLRKVAMQFAVFPGVLTANSSPAATPADQQKPNTRSIA